MEAMQNYGGWEEGVVENLQRLIRSEVLMGINVTVDESVFLWDEEECGLNPFVDAFEAWRATVAGVEGYRNQSAIAFYSSLLQTELSERRSAVYLSLK